MRAAAFFYPWNDGAYELHAREWLQVEGLEKPTRVFPCATPEEVRATLPVGKDVLAFQCRNPIHKAHYELFTRALDADNVGEGAVCLVHPTCGPTQDDDIPGITRYQYAAPLTPASQSFYTVHTVLPLSIEAVGHYCLALEVYLSGIQVPLQ